MTKNMYINEKQINICNIKLSDQLRIYQNYFIKFSDISIDLKHAWNRIGTVPAAEGTCCQLVFIQEASIFSKIIIVRIMYF